MSYLSPDRLDQEILERAVVAPGFGAVVTFSGNVRNHHEGRQVVGLKYLAYGPMAERECGAIVAEAESKWQVRVALRHRTGELEIGDTAVVVVAAGAHREEAFSACRFVIEQVKRRVPIWKLERYQDGTEAWVDPTAVGGIAPSTARPSQAGAGSDSR